MFDSSFSVFESVFDTFFENFGNLFLNVSRNIFPDHITAQRERKSGYRLPPQPKIERQFEPLSGVGYLAFVNNQSDVRLAGFHRVENFVKSNRHSLHFWSEQPQSQIRTRF